MIRQNADPNKGVAFEYNFVAAYPKSVKKILQFKGHEIFKNTLVQQSLHCAAFGK